MKLFIIFITFVVSTSSYGCKPTTKMDREVLMTTGVLNKLKNVTRFNDFIIKSITNNKNKKLVQIQNPKTKECLELTMSPYVKGACDNFSADIISEVKIQKDGCVI